MTLYPCCEHCEDDWMHDTDPDEHDLPCQVCQHPRYAVKEIRPESSVLRSYNQVAADNDRLRGEVFSLRQTLEAEADKYKQTYDALLRSEQARLALYDEKAALMARLQKAEAQMTAARDERCDEAMCECCD